MVIALFVGMASSILEKNVIPDLNVLLAVLVRPDMHHTLQRKRAARTIPVVMELCNQGRNVTQVLDAALLTVHAIQQQGLSPQTGYVYVQMDLE